MTPTSTTHRRRSLLRLTAHATAIGTFASLAAASMTFANPAAAAAVTTMSEPQPNAAPPAASPQGFIMGDGRICNPRWGC